VIGTLTHIIKDKDVAFTYNRQVASYHPQPTQKTPIYSRIDYIWICVNLWLAGFQNV